MSPDETASAGLIDRLALGLALFGGAVLLALVGLSALSILGRSLAGLPFLAGLGLGPVPGDFELVEVGTAVAVSSFLPICERRGGHLAVEIVTLKAGPRLTALIVLVSRLLMALAAAVLGTMLAEGMVERFSTGESTMILALPSWVGYALSLPGIALFSVAAAAGALAAGRDLLAPGARP
ncbi:MAG TPA: TRAP transporter small permease subunit [Hyphomicrobiales bacterium]|nr:TRAP transporter small permease subunit [Hyphomicrobiales bacterium]